MLNRAEKRQHDETEKDHAERVGKFLRKRPVFLTVEKTLIFEEDLHTSLIHIQCIQEDALKTGSKKPLAGDVITIDVS